MSEPGFAATLVELRQTVVSRVRTYDKVRAAQRLQDAALRGAFAGVATRGGLHLVTYLLHLLMGGRKKKKAGRPDGRAMLADTARWGAFLGTFSGGFVVCDELIAMLGGRRRTAAWRAMVSGALAGPALLLTGGQQTHTSLSLYVFVRGLVLLIRCGNLPGAHPLKRKLLAPTRWAHGDLALMCLSSVQLSYSWMLLPQTLPPSFVRFLNKHGGKEPHVYEGIREMCSRASAGLPPGATPLAALAGTECANFCGPTACPFLHPGQGCVQHAVTFFPASYLRSLPVYFPVYLIPAIMVHRKKLVQPGTAPELWRKLAVGVLRSSLFLSLFCTLAWGGVCTSHALGGRTSGALFAGSCWVGGLSLLSEKPSRRMELALYLFSRAVESFALSTVAWGLVRPGALPRRMDVLLFSLAAGFILHCYSDHFGERRNVFRSSYLATFDFILGNTGFKQASISHQPSNAAILLRGMRSVKSMGNLLLRGSSGLGGKTSNGGGNNGNGSGHGGSSSGSGRTSSGGGVWTGGRRSGGQSPASALSPEVSGLTGESSLGGIGGLAEAAGAGAEGEGQAEGGGAPAQLRDVEQFEP